MQQPGAAGWEVPAGLVYACEDAPETQAVFLPVGENHKVVVVIEPGCDPGVMWEQLQRFLRREGVPECPAA